MSDLALQRRFDGTFDLDFDEKSGDLRVSESLENSVIISIGTNARSRDLKNGANLQPVLGGWWADSLSENGTLGGHVFECFDSKLTETTCRDVEREIVKSLNWMVDDGIAAAVSCKASIGGKTEAGDSVMNVDISIEKPIGDSDKFAFEILWKSIYGV